MCNNIKIYQAELSLSFQTLLLYLKSINCKIKITFSGTFFQIDVVSFETELLNCKLNNLNYNFHLGKNKLYLKRAISQSKYALKTKKNRYLLDIHAKE